MIFQSANRHFWLFFFFIICSPSWRVAAPYLMRRPVCQWRVQAQPRTVQTCVRAAMACAIIYMLLLSAKGSFEINSKHISSKNTKYHRSLRACKCPRICDWNERWKKNKHVHFIYMKGRKFRETDFFFRHKQRACAFVVHLLLESGWNGCCCAHACGMIWFLCIYAQL